MPTSASESACCACLSFYLMPNGKRIDLYRFFFNLWGGTFGTAATTGLLYQPRVIVMVIAEKLVE
jgi:hypothetical protein